MVVRRTTLTTIINLLQEDYLKLTGNLFFRILQTLSDDSEEILNLTTFFIQQRLLKRRPKVMYSHFIEALFHFNEYKVNQMTILDIVVHMQYLKRPRIMYLHNIHFFHNSSIIL